MYLSTELRAQIKPLRDNLLKNLSTSLNVSDIYPVGCTEIAIQFVSPNGIEESFTVEVNTLLDVSVYNERDEHILGRSDFTGLLISDDSHEVATAVVRIIENQIS
jgi:hypothetical protein